MSSTIKKDVFQHAVVEELGRAMGMTLNHYTAALLRLYLKEKGYPEDKLNLVVNAVLVVNGKPVKVDVLNLDPLIVVEVTTSIKDADEARREVDKLIEKKRLIESLFNKRAELAALAIANVEEEAFRRLESKLRAKA